MKRGVPSEARCTRTLRRRRDAGSTTAGVFTGERRRPRARFGLVNLTVKFTEYPRVLMRQQTTGETANDNFKGFCSPLPPTRQGRVLVRSEPAMLASILTIEPLISDVTGQPSKRQRSLACSIGSTRSYCPVPAAAARCEDHSEQATPQPNRTSMTTWSVRTLRPLAPALDVSARKCRTGGRRGRCRDGLWHELRATLQPPLRPTMTGFGDQWSACADLIGTFRHGCA